MPRKRIEAMFANGNQQVVPLMNGEKTFTATLVEGGINVTNLGAQPFLPWAVFTTVVELLSANGGNAIKGCVRRENEQIRLDDLLLPLNSVEGAIAHQVYHQQIGESVFQRISPVAGILSWAGICINNRGSLTLIPQNQ